MRAIFMIRCRLEKSLEFMHNRRLEALFCAVEGVLRGQRLLLTWIGRNLPSKAHVRHRIKRVDRLLSNVKLQGEVRRIYAALASLVLAGTKRPVVVVDISQVHGAMDELRAAIPFGGRAQTLYTEVHPHATVTQAQTFKQFLSHFACVLPSGCKPVVVTDAGYYASWFDAVTAMGWDYIGRVRNNVCIQETLGGPWQCAKTLYVRATLTAQDLGIFLIRKGRPCTRRLVLIKAKRTSPKHPYPKCSPHHEQKARSQSQEPWLLATSLTVAASEITRLYATRMQIEETFRDQKNHRYGWCARDLSSHVPERLTVMLLIAALAQYAQTILGCVAESMHWNKTFTTNTRTSRPVHSRFYLGALVLQTERLKPDMQQLRQAQQLLRKNLVCLTRKGLIC